MFFATLGADALLQEPFQAGGNSVSKGTFPQAPSPRLEQEREIVEILVAARGPLVPDELFQSDEMHGQGFLPVREPFRLAALPGNGKTFPFCCSTLAFSIPSTVPPQNS